MLEPVDTALMREVPLDGNRFEVDQLLVDAACELDALRAERDALQALADEQAEQIASIVQGSYSASLEDLRARITAIGPERWRAGHWITEQKTPLISQITLLKHRLSEARQPAPQEDVLAWTAERWPHTITPLFRAAKMCEEAGEVMGAVIKMDEGRKTLDDLRQEVAQLVLCAKALAEVAGFSLEIAVDDEWRRCRS